MNPNTHNRLTRTANHGSKLKILYTVILIFCLSAFASSNECARHFRGDLPCKEQVKEMHPEDKPAMTEKEEMPVYSPLLVTLYV